MNTNKSRALSYSTSVYTVSTIPSRLLSTSGSRWLLEQNSHLWLRPLVVAGVLLLSAALAFKASPRYLMVILGLLFGVGATLVFICWPPLGLVALIGTIIVPFNGPSGLNATMAVVALLLGLWLLDMMMRQRRIQLLPSRPIWPLLAFVVTAGLAFGVGQLPWYPFAQPAPMGAQLGGLAIFILSAGAFLLVAHQVRDPRWLKWMTWLFLALGGLYVIGHLVPGMGHFTRPYSAGTTGSLFWTWLVALALSQAIFNSRLHPVWRIMTGGLAMATLYIGLFPGRSWSSGWIPPLVAAIVTVWVARPRLASLAMPVALIGAIAQNKKLVSLVMIGDNQYSLMTRLEAWNIVLEIVKVNPILGLGPANYRWYTPLFPILGWSVQFNSHSQYVDLIAQTGLLGLAFFLWFFWAVGKLGWRLREQVPIGFARAYVYGTVGGLAGTLVAGALGDWVLPFFYNVTLGGFRSSVLGWLFLGGLVALDQIFATRTQTVQKE